MTDWAKKLTENLDKFIKEIQADEDLKRVAKDIKSTGEKAWGKMQSTVENIVEKVNEIPDSNWTKIAKGAFDGKIVIPSSTVKKKLEQALLKSKTDLKQIEILFAKDFIHINFELDSGLPIKGNFSISIFQVNISKLQQTITFKVNKPIEIESQGLPEEAICMLSSILGFSLNGSIDLETLLPDNVKNLAKKDDLWQIDLSKFEELNKWSQKKLMGKTILDFFAVYDAKINSEHITLYPQLKVEL